MRKLLISTVAAAAVLAAGSAQAADKLKIGFMATLEGTYTVLGEDGQRGFQVAMKEAKAMAGGREIDQHKNGGEGRGPQEHRGHKVVSMLPASAHQLDHKTLIIRQPPEQDMCIKQQIHCHPPRL